jgi:SnoaL-like protein
MHALITARGYHDAWTSGRLEDAGRFLDEHVAIEVPVNSYDGRDSFMLAVAGFGQLASAVTLLAEFASDDDAMLLYDMTVPQLGQMRVAEHFTVTAGRIIRLRQVHDTAGLRVSGLVAPDAPINGAAGRDRVVSDGL